jgi:hypothetical protein
MDADTRLQSSFSRVLIAVCGGGEARIRAQRAVSVAEAALKQAPSDERALAVMNAEDELGHAISAEGDWPGARAMFERAAARADGQSSDVWQDALHRVLRDLAYTISDGPERARTATIVRDDLLWQQGRLATRPDDAEILSQQAADYRQLAIVARTDNDAAAVADAVGREADILRRLAIKEPANLNWQRFLAFNARSKSILLANQGDAAGALAKAREASSLAASLLMHDPENALWRITALNMDVRLAVMLMRTGDEVGARAVLRPDIEAVQALALPGSSVLCQSEAAQMQSAIGNAMVVLGQSEDGIAALVAGVGLARSIAAAGPPSEIAQAKIVEAELQLTRALMVLKQQDGVIAHASAGITALQPLLAAAADNADRQTTLSELRRFLGDAQLASGNTSAALATFETDQTTLRTLVVSHPTEHRWRVQLANSLLRSAAVYVATDHPDQQWLALQAASAALSPIEGRTDVPAAWQLALIDVRQAIGTAEVVRHDYDAALTNYKAALQQAEALIRIAPHDVQARSALAQALAWVGTGYRFSGDTAQATNYAAQSQAAFADIIQRR